MLRTCSWLLIGSVAFSSPAFAEFDLSGTWVRVDQDWRAVEPVMGYYVSLPINDAARLAGDTWTPLKWTVPEHQCEVHPYDYGLLFNHLKIESPVDVGTQMVRKITMTAHFGVPERTIWMDGRPAPSEYAPYTYGGFASGRWEGDTLIVTTTHMKFGFLRRNGLPRSEKAKITEYWTRNDDFLNVVVVVDDPAYLTEPLVRSGNFRLDPGYLHEPAGCSARVETERPRGYVAHILPGDTNILDEARASTQLPPVALRGGANTTTPEFAREMRELALKRSSGSSAR